MLKKDQSTESSNGLSESFETAITTSCFVSLTTSGSKAKSEESMFNVTSSHWTGESALSARRSWRTVDVGSGGKSIGG